MRPFPKVVMGTNGAEKLIYWGLSSDKVVYNRKQLLYMSVCVLTEDPSDLGELKDVLNVLRSMWLVLTLRRGFTISRALQRWG